MERPIKFFRGQVWYRDDKVTNKYDSSDSIQRGKRPVLIFSSDKGNATNSFVNVIPLSCKHKPDIAVNIEVLNDNGLTQVALCNQLTPCDKSELIRYEYTVTEVTMTKVERGVMIANQLDKYIKNLDTKLTFDQLKDVIEGIVQNRVNEILKDKKAESTYITTDNIREMVDNLVSTDSKEEKTETCPTVGKVEAIDDLSIGNAIMKDALKNVKVSEKPEPIKKKSNTNSAKRRKSSSSKWTIDVCRQFVKDKDILPASEMVVKYELKDVKQVCQYYYYCNSKINKYEKELRNND